ncbi:MAG TPA: hypothetical protein VMG12_15870 [Polyangiaceae bacterium]|nr:hypothetical protein [Polyangiaceae bacterium]
MTVTSEREIARQKLSNSNAAQHHAAYANHRLHLTELLMARREAAAPTSSDGPRLCVLGAGNCGDLDLERLATRYRSIHLVDIDAEALERARQRQSAATRAALVSVAPLDLSGLLEPLERWKNMQMTPDEMLAHPGRSAANIADSIGGPFDVVVSACVLSQMHLSVRHGLGDSHPLFQAAGYTLNLTHLHTLARLAAPGRGVALLVSDVATEQMAPLERAGALRDLRGLLEHQLSAGAVFDAVRPDTLVAIACDDPGLVREFGLSNIVDAWVWKNGPRRSFLVYALELPRIE